MKKSNIISQIAFAWGLGVISVAPVWAQTCIKTPSCADLGYTKTTTACTGKTILKCPLDTTKVYCPSDEETSKIYKVGDLYKFNNVTVGYVFRVLANGYMVTTQTKAGSMEEAKNFCDSLSINASYGSSLWYLPSKDDYNLMVSVGLLNPDSSRAYYNTSDGKAYYFIGDHLSASNGTGTAYRCIASVL